MKDSVTLSRMDPRVNQLLFGTAPKGAKDPSLGINWSATITYTPQTLRTRCSMTDEQILELFPELADQSKGLGQDSPVTKSRKLKGV